MAQAHAQAAAYAQEDQSQLPVDISALQSMGINVSDISKAKAAGIHTVGLLLMTPRKRLLDIKGFSDVKVNKLLESAKALKNVGFVSGTEALAIQKQRVKITTGSNDLDALLGGGVETGTITEIFGEGRSGKTQLVSMLCVTSQLARENGGGEGRVIVLDTDNKFRLDRVGEIAEKRFGLSRDDVLENIMYAKCNTHEQQMEMIGVAMGKIAESEEPIRMIVVDSVMALYRTEFTGRGELADRQQKLGSHLRDLCKLAQEFNVAVVLTNQMTADPGNAMVADAKKPVGGNILAHSVDSRIYLRKGRGTQRIAKIYAGPHPESEATFSITDKGIVEAE